MPNTIPEQNFQPQVGDTTNGEHKYTYIPRADGSILIGGVIYVQQATTVGAVPIVAAPVQQPVYPAPATAPVYQPYIATPLPVYQGQPYYQPQPPMQYLNQGPYIPQQYGISAYNMGYPTPAYGQTGSEVLAGQIYLAQESDINKKQDMKPADDDPNRMYWCRELDGTWTQRNRQTLDSGDIGDCRWYVMDGQFYAVRLSDG